MNTVVGALLIRQSAYRMISADTRNTRPAIAILVATMAAGVAGIWGSLHVFGPSEFAMILDAGTQTAETVRRLEERALPVTLLSLTLGVVLGFPMWPVLVHQVARGITNRNIDFGATFRVVSYAGLICLLGLFFYLPGGLGTAIAVGASLWSLAATTVGLKVACDIGVGRALAIVLVASALMMMLWSIVFCALLLPVYLEI